jgi:isoleucyl-tRNA synthetase
MGTLWNTYAFFVLYANIDGFDATNYTLDYEKLNLMDRWLLSRLNTLMKEVDGHLGAYRIPETARVLDSFVDDMSNWYVRRSRERFWAKGMEQDKINAYMSLYTALVTVSKLAAPMIPFMTEEIYRNLVCSLDSSAPESVHLCDFPMSEEAYIDQELEAHMANLLKVVVMGRAARNTGAIKNRQPIGTMFVKTNFNLPKLYVQIIEEELNIKKVTFVEDASSFISYAFKPQLRTVGPKYGKYLKQIQQALAELDGNTAMDTLKKEGALHLPEISTDIVLTEEDLLISTTQQEGFVTEGDDTLTVVLDTSLTPALIEEGFVRELVSKIQTMRKEAGFEVTDKIALSYEAGDTIKKVFEKNSKQIQKEVLANSLMFGEGKGYRKEWDINGEAVTLAVEK